MDSLEGNPRRFLRLVELHGSLVVSSLGESTARVLRALGNVTVRVIWWKQRFDSATDCQSALILERRVPMRSPTTLSLPVLRSMSRWYWNSSFLGRGGVGWLVALVGGSVRLLWDDSRCVRGIDLTYRNMAWSE